VGVVAPSTPGYARRVRAQANSLPGSEVAAPGGGAQAWKDLPPGLASFVIPVPVQRTRVWSGEVSLLVAVLADAAERCRFVGEKLHPARAKRLRPPVRQALDAEAAELRAWLTSQHTGPFTLEWVCDCLSSTIGQKLVPIDIAAALLPILDSTNSRPAFHRMHHQGRHMKIMSNSRCL
jgi:hypothetical protein